MNQKILWTPHPRQATALKRREFEILYGGARGGGKTDAGMMWLTYDVSNSKLRALIIRKNADDLKDWVDRAGQVYTHLGATIVGKPAEIRWPSGAIFRAGHLKDETTYTKYQGHEYQRMLIEELTQIPSETAYLRLLSSCRSTVKGLSPQIFCTTNPGGAGHAWVKERFIDVAPPETSYKPKQGRSRIFIPATIDDNPTLTKNDPDYIDYLETLKDKDEDLYKAWRHGSWDVFAGQVFNEFRRDLHVLPRLTPKSTTPHFLSMDWGYSAPFAGYAHALIKMKSRDGDIFHRIVTYQEWYGTGKHPSEWAKIIYKTARHKDFRQGYADSAMFNVQTDGSVSIIDEMDRTWKNLNRNKWLTMNRGSRNRIGRVATMHNWLSIAPDGKPYWMVTEDCVNLIRTLPMLVYDEHRTEDVDTTQEDHAYDALTYYLASAKFITGNVGAQKHRKYIPQFISQISEEGQEALDLNEFANAQLQKSRDWRMV